MEVKCRVSGYFTCNDSFSLFFLFSFFSLLFLFVLLHNADAANTYLLYYCTTATPNS